DIEHRDGGRVDPLVADPARVEETVQPTVGVPLRGPVVHVGVEAAVVLHRAQRRDLAAGVGDHRRPRVVEERQRDVHREEQERGGDDPAGAVGHLTASGDDLRVVRRARPRRRGERAQRCLRARSTSSLGIVAASAYSGAWAMKPGGGGGSSMCSTRSPESAITLMYRLSGRWMKGNLTPGETSST